MTIIEFDPAKDAVNRAKHGISLAAAAELLKGPILVIKDDRRNYGEDRWLAIGSILGVIHVCTYTYRDGRERIISLRPANRKERRRYAQKFT